MSQRYTAYLIFRTATRDGFAQRRGTRGPVVSAIRRLRRRAAGPTIRG